MERRDTDDGEGVLVGLSVFSSVYLLSFCSSFLSIAFVLSLLRRNCCCCCGTWWRLVWGYVDREGCFGCRGRNGWGGLWLARRGKMRGKTAIAESVERDEGRDGTTESLCWWPAMGPETGNGWFGFVLGLRGKESFWLARRENETEGKRLESGRRECWCCGRVSVG